MGRDKDVVDSFIAAWKSGKGIYAHTSGSTGTPKRIILSKAHLVRSALRTVNFFGIDRNSHLHSAISFDYIGGKMMIARSLLANCRLSWQSPSLHPQAPSSPVKLMSVVAAQMPSIISRINEFSHVENFLIGGSAIPPEIWRAIVSSGIMAFESYGMTETASHIALRQVMGNRPDDVPFVPLPGIRVELSEEQCLLISDGELKVKTNDLAEITPEGGFFILGRKDDMIITGGKKVLPQTIEKILADHLDFGERRYIVVSRPHSVWTSEIILLVESSDSAPLLLSKKLKEMLSAIPEEDLPGWQRPKEIIIVKELSTTPSGKIRRIIP